MNGVSWDYFDKFEKINKMYLPDYGEGETKATQIVTAVNKLIYKWYNDGDVFDNTSVHGLTGWCNDLSSYANWLVKYTDRADCLYAIFDIETEDEYEQLLKELADTIFDEKYLEKMNELDKTGTIYECEQSFKFECLDDDEDEDEFYFGEEDDDDGE